MLPPQSVVTIKNQTEIGPEANARRQGFLARAGSIAFLLFGFSLLTGCTPAGPKALLDGKRRIEQGRYPQAIQELRTATSLLPTNAAAWNYLGVAYHYAGQPAEAEKAYQQALALDRDLSEAHYNLGCLWLEQNKTNAAKNELTTFTLRRANSFDGWFKLGLAQLRARDLSGAEKSFGEALRLNPHHAGALNGLGLARVQRGRHPEATQLFGAALKAQPDFHPALLNLAIVDQQYVKDRPAAVRAYQTYLAARPAPEHVEPIKSLVRQLEQEMAQPRVLATNPVAPPLTNLPAPKAAIPQPPSAVARPVEQSKAEVKSEPRPVPPTNEYEVVRVPADPVIRPAEDIPATPKDAQAEPVRLAENHATPESKAAKRGLLQRVNPLNLFRNDPKTTNSPAAIPEPAQDGSAGAARYGYRTLPKPVPGNRTAAQPWFNQGVQAQQAARSSEALQAFARAIELDGAFFEAYYNRGLVNSEAGNATAALEAYEYALAVRPESVDARYNFGLLLKQEEFFSDAVNEFNRILAGHPRDTRTHLALGNLYAQQLGNPAKAREHYLKVIETDPRHPQAGAIRFWLSSNP
jgi:tetratricopeptide (TPR) repeat protein